MLKACTKELIRIVVALLASLLIASCLLRYSAGSEVDERELDVRLSAESRASARQALAAANSLSIPKIMAVARRAFAGDLGSSVSFGAPVSELIRDRYPVTLRAVSIAWLATIAAAFGAALITSRSRSRALQYTASAGTILILAIPSAVLALVLARLRWPVAAALSIAAFPQTYRIAHNILRGVVQSPAVLSACARGIGGARLALFHILLPAAPELLGTLALTLTTLVSVSIPIEALSGTAGLGYLAWQAAIARDLPLITSITVLVALSTLLASSASEIGSAALGAGRAR